MITKNSIINHIMFIVLTVTSVSCYTADDTLSVVSSTPDTLFNTISALDGAVFDAFNHCSSPEQLQRHANYFAPDIEFYHDTGGVTWTRKDMLASTSKNVCGKYQRELIRDSLAVFPIKDFGAVAQGTHRFCQITSGKCEGIADFTIVWRKQGDNWQITRVLSYAHRTNQQAE